MPISDEAIILLAGFLAYIGKSLFELSKKRQDGKSEEKVQERALSVLNNIHAAQIQHAKDCERTEFLVAKLDQSHHAQFAHDSKNRLRWHGAEIADHLEELGRKVDRQTSVLADAIRDADERNKGSNV